MQSRQLNLLAAEFITFPAATIFLILRIISRRITRAKFWWDDFFAVLCYATAVGWAVVLPIWIHHGFGLHSDDVKGMSVIEANYLTKKYLFVIEHLYAFTLFFAKLSVLSFYWRMFRVANIQIIISVWLVCSIVWIIARTLLTTFHCYPVHAFWDPNVKNHTCLIKSSDFFFGTVLTHVIIDIGILILPVMQIQKLQLPLLQKVAIMLMFMFGTLVCVAGFFIVSIATRLDNKSLDMTWHLAPIITWASVEVNLVIISGKALYSPGHLCHTNSLR
ncbi:related to L-fucose permease [Fusarium torulosum]|uniref:Related to L-fucose permease n=1 Tax=Fusarium torulosum TaxID=33205 RepID=A0AAE8M518_9HYPO|nr:related to L-fucose permease [Fusarium torulosum]